MRSRSDRGARRCAAVLAAMWLTCALPGWAALDVSGNWRMTLVQFPVRIPVTLAQHGTALTGTIGVGIDAGPGSGTIDPETGAFSLAGSYTLRPGIPEGPPEVTCAYQLVATTDADGQRFAGRLDDSCVLHTAVTGVRETCGNGTVDAGEACDAAFPCCTSACELRPEGAPCPDDGNVCTDDRCDADAVCTHVPSSAPCSVNGCTADTCVAGGCVQGAPLPTGTTCVDDGNPCTADECDAVGGCHHTRRPAGAPCADDTGTCRRHSCTADGRCVAAEMPCGPCETCFTGQCYPTTSLICGPPSAGSVVDLYAPALGRTRLQWTWDGVAPGFPFPSDFGDPRTTAQFALCVYVTTPDGVVAAGTTVPPGEACGDQSCWSARSGGFTYANLGDAAGTGVRVMRVATRRGLQHIRVAAAGDWLRLSASLAGSQVIMQLVKAGTFPTCWQATFTTPFVYTPTRFRARQ